MGLFDQIKCGCSNENTSCTTDNEPVENVGVGSTSPEESCNVGVGSTTPAPAPKPKPAPAQSCCNVGVGSSSAARGSCVDKKAAARRRRVSGR